MRPTDEDCRAFLSVDDALAMLPDGEEIHTFVNSRGCLIGADWPREKIVALIREGTPELTGPMATRMGHGLCVGNVFIATKEESPCK